MKKFIITADDFGLSDSVNRGIIGAFHRGLISSASILINQPFTSQAVEFWHASSNLGLGLHVNLTRGKSLLTQKEFSTEIIKDSSVSLDQIKQEILTQLLTAKQLNLNIDHLDFHHHLEENPVIMQALQEISKSENLPVRKGLVPNAITTDDICWDFYQEKASAETLISFYEKLPENKTAEIVTHIGFMDNYTKEHTSYTQREADLHQLELLKQQGFYQKIQLTTFRDLGKDMK